MNNNQPNYYGHHISSINLSFIELESASQQVRLAEAPSGSSGRVLGCLAIGDFMVAIDFRGHRFGLVVYITVMTEISKLPV